MASTSSSTAIESTDEAAADAISSPPRTKSEYVVIRGTIVDVPVFSRGHGGKVLIDDPALDQLRIFD